MDENTQAIDTAEIEAAEVLAAEARAQAMPIYYRVVDIETMQPAENTGRYDTREDAEAVLRQLDADKYTITENRDQAQ